MFALKTLGRFTGTAPVLETVTTFFVQKAGLKDYAPPKTYDHVEIPTERQKLRVLMKVPNYNNIRPPKMQKRLILMRGPDREHNKQLIHKQYGVIALEGGRIKYPHIELARLSIGRKMDTSKMFSIWRIADPWQPLTKKGIGVRMGAGKGSIDHYCTPVKAGRVILEIAGKCSFAEVKPMLEHVARSMPFKAMAVSQEILEEMEAKKERNKKRNSNYFTKQYVIQNNLGGCHRWLGKYDHHWFGEYV